MSAITSASPIVTVVNPLGDLHFETREHFKEIFNKVVGQEYLIEQVDGHEDLRLHTLVQLALVNIPYTAEQKKVFDVARKVDAECNKWLGWQGYLSINALPLVFALMALVPWGGITSLSSEKQLAIVMLLSALALIISVSLGMKFTGNNTKGASDEQNKDQEAIITIQERLDECALYMIYQYARGDEKIKELLGLVAQEINTKTMAEDLGKVTTQKSAVKAVFCKLSYALTFVKESRRPPLIEVECLLRA